jgi:hypothetical protein
MVKKGKEVDNEKSKNWSAVKIGVIITVVSGLVLLSIPFIYNVIGTVVAQPGINTKFEGRIVKEETHTEQCKSFQDSMAAEDKENKVYLRMLQEDVNIIKEAVLNKK